MNLLMRTLCQDACTTGILTVGGMSLTTMELPWRENESMVSCVPAGEYQLIPYASPTHGQTWRLHNPNLGVWGLSDAPPTPARTEVEIHTGNFASDSEACILVGMRAGQLLNPKSDVLESAVLDSDIAMTHLRDLLDSTTEDDLLTIERSGSYP